MSQYVSTNLIIINIKHTYTLIYLMLININITVHLCEILDERLIALDGGCIFSECFLSLLSCGWVLSAGRRMEWVGCNHGDNE